jgi:hypothetical protein
MSSSFRLGESIETPSQHVDYLRRNEYKYRHLFKDYESYEVFMMLPVDDKGRQLVLASLRSEPQELPRETDSPQS